MKREKKCEHPDLLSIDRARRDFLIRCCQGVVLLPGLTHLAGPSFRFADRAPEVARASPFHLHPHYRTPLPLEAMLAKVKAGSDSFVNEKYHDQLATIFKPWIADLLKSPRDLQVIERVLTPEFEGVALGAPQTQMLRAGPPLEIRNNSFSSKLISRDIFLQHLGSYLRGFSKLITVEFQITSIDASPEKSPAGLPQTLLTKVRYELVGSGAKFYREQRVGYWQMEWKSVSSGDFLLSKWQALEETQSRTFAPAFVDITGATLAQAVSYESQLAFGVDYWRTVLDGASGIDIYGHNGVAFGDIDNDGFDDLYVCQPAGLPNRLYRNRGDGTFEDITDSAGVGVLENTACALFADLNNNGRQDLIVVRADGPTLFINERTGKFRQSRDAFRFATLPQGTFTGAAIADYDRDGWLDIYFCLYTYYQGADQYKYPLPYYDAENGPPNFLMRNNRDGTFRDVTSQSGLNQNNTRYSFCCAWNDFNGDGWPDLYVVNDFGRKNLYRNNGNGTFTDIAPQAGVEDIGAGMSVCWLDYDNNGADDLYVGDMWTAAGERVSSQPLFQPNAPPNARAAYHKHAMGNSLFRNHREAKFQDTTMSSGAGVGRWAWSCDSWDFDHDGFPDIYIVNGMVSGPVREDLNSFFWRQVVANSPNQAAPSHIYEQGWTAINELIRSDVSWSGYERNILYANNHDGTFSDVSGALGLDFIQDGRTFALADIDHDGRLEVVLKNRNGPQLRILKNVIENLGPSIAFHLQGSKSNRDAIGAVVSIETESGRQTRTLQAGSGFLAQHSKEVFFGLGDAAGKVRASIRWPSGLVQQFKDLPINHRISVEEGSEQARTEPFRPTGRVSPAEQALANQFPDSSETWLLAPIAAPDFSLADLNGEKRTLHQLRSRSACVYFWTTQTSSWRADLQALNGLGRGCGVLAINVDDSDQVDNLRAAVRQHSFQFPIVQADSDIAAVYNILYLQLFDRHRDLTLPTAFLLDAGGRIVKLYQGTINADHIVQDAAQIPAADAERAARGLPFRGISEGSEYRRNYLSYGSLYYQRGYYEQAENFFKLAIQDDPSRAEALYGLGSVYLEQKKNKEAQDSFERVTAMQPSYPDTLPNAWNNLGLLAARDGRLGEATRDFQRALEISPDHPIALVNLGNAYRQEKQWDDARRVLERAVAVNPEDPDANYSLGMVFAQLNQPDRAYEFLQAALRFRPDDPEALNNLGILYLRTERPEQAVATFEQCIRVAPGFDQAYMNLARVYALEGKPDKARATLQQLLVQHPGHEQAQKALEELGR